MLYGSCRLAGWNDVCHDVGWLLLLDGLGLGGAALHQGSQVLFSVPVLLQLPNRAGKDMTAPLVRPSAPCCAEHKPKQTPWSMELLAGRNLGAPNKMQPPLGWVVTVTDLSVVGAGQKVKGIYIYIFF